MSTPEIFAMQQTNIAILKSQRLARSFDGKPGLVKCVIEMRDNQRKIEQLRHAYQTMNRRRQQEP
jgi:hypothetical protein